MKKLIFLIGVYLISIVAANLLVGEFGKYSVFIVGFLFIGLDITTRDSIHELFGKYVFAKMVLLVGCGSILSYWLNQDVANIAKASFVAFLTAGLLDTLVYGILHNKSKGLKVNGSNVVSSFADSFLFIYIAFGLDWFVILGQTTVKIFGGYIWFLVLNKLQLFKNKI